MGTTEGARVLDDLECFGYSILRGIIPREALVTTSTHIWTSLAKVLASDEPRDDIKHWAWKGHWLPEIRFDPQITDLADYFPQELKTEVKGYPQILIQLPEQKRAIKLVTHVDRLPDDWPGGVEGLRYRCIIGVALTNSHVRNGGLLLDVSGQPGPAEWEDLEPVELAAGDIVVMAGDLPHTSGLNISGQPRVCVYFRYLEPIPEAEQ